jgi:hypothetical protein
LANTVPDSYDRIVGGFQVQQHYLPYMVCYLHMCICKVYKLKKCNCSDKLENDDTDA